MPDCAVMTDGHTEYTFLCGYQRIRRYGSTQDLHSPTASGSAASRRPVALVQHHVEPNDTLQSLELKYNSNMYEIKRVNRLWSNDSLYCKTVVKIPLYDGSPSGVTPTDDQATPSPPPRLKSKNSKSSLHHVSHSGLQTVEEGTESLDDFFKRIDTSVKKTKKAVKRLDKKSIVPAS